VPPDLYVEKFLPVFN